MKDLQTSLLADSFKLLLDPAISLEELESLVLGSMGRQAIDDLTDQYSVRDLLLRIYRETGLCDLGFDL